MLLQTKVKVNGPSSDHIQHIPNPQIPNFFVNYVSKFWYEPQLREADPFQNGWFFGKVPKGGVSFSIQKFMLQIFAIKDDTSVMNFGKNLQHNFPKMSGGGGQRPFGTFPKIHPFWKGKASLSQPITIKISMCIWFSYISPLLPKSPKIHCFP